MKPFSKYKLNQISKSLDYYFNQARPIDIFRGKQWYISANQLVNVIGKSYNYDKHTVASVISALSPRNKWERNIQDAITVLSAVNDNIHHSHIKVCTFNRNKLKAFNIAKGLEKITESSRKTFAFVKNISYLDTDRVTIDVWHLRACSKYTKMPEMLNKSQYDQVQQLTIQKAKQHNLKGYEYQAIVWCVIRGN